MRIYKFRAWHTDDMVMVYDLNSPRLYHGKLIGKDYILMQYTGLKDKSGKEIWEGDVVKTIPYHKEKPEIMAVNWELLPKCGGCPYQEWGVGFNLGWYALDHLEVIGNIYDNPVLLK